MVHPPILALIDSRLDTLILSAVIAPAAILLETIAFAAILSAVIVLVLIQPPLIWVVVLTALSVHFSTMFRRFVIFEPFEEVQEAALSHLDLLELIVFCIEFAVLWAELAVD